MANKNTKSKPASKPASKSASKSKSITSPPAVSSTNRKDTKTLADLTEAISRNNRKAAAEAKNLTDISKELTGVWGDFATVVQESAKYMDGVSDGSIKATIAIKDNLNEINNAAKDIYANLEDIGSQYCH